MPRYDYTCPNCGLLEATRSYEDYTIPCEQCGGVAERVPVYQEQGVIFKGAGFTKSVLPPPPQTTAEKQEVQELYGNEVRKRGWSADRAVEEMRRSKFTDTSGQLRIDTRKMTQKAS